MDEKLNYLVKRISKIKQVQAIILFGSQLKKPRKDSDFDITVLIEKISREKELEIIGLGDDAYNISIFHRLPPIIQFRIIKEGKVLFVRDTFALHKEKIKAIRTYLDFAPFIQRFYRKRLNEI